MFRHLTISSLALAALGFIPSAQAVDCWGMKTAPDITNCLARNNFNNDSQKAASFYRQNAAQYHKPALMTLDMSVVKYQLNGNHYDLFDRNGVKVGTLANGIAQPLPPANMVAAGGGNVVGQNGSGMVAAGGGNFNNAIVAALNANPPVAPMTSRYTLAGVNNFNALKQKSRQH